MNIQFTFARIPHLYFGSGRFNEIGKIAGRTGKIALIVTGAQSFQSSDKWDVLLKALEDDSISYHHFIVRNEPSPELVDEAVNQFKNKNIEVVLAIGGGSTIDAGKAISAMLPSGESVFDYLEGVGRGASHSGMKIPFIAVPTTSGTGSETTKNAVLSRIGSKGFKKSLRHDNFVPDIAVLDPELTITCPFEVSATCGMDAFTQLIESYVSKKSSPMTDALAFSGLESLKDSLIPSCTDGTYNIEPRSKMAYASFISGITLANAGLGVVHGFASSMGGFFDIPHGVVCGTLIGAATKVSINNLKNNNKTDALKKYANVGRLFSETEKHPDNVDYILDILCEKIDEWTEILKLPRLGQYGIKESDFDRIIDATSNKESPAELHKEDLKKILSIRL